MQSETKVSDGDRAEIQTVRIHERNLLKYLELEGTLKTTYHKHILYKESKAQGGYVICARLYNQSWWLRQ